MGAILGGTMRSPFTGIVFALELTHDFNMLLPLLIANFLAHGFTVLTLKRSILTEKISRRGYHLSREYGLDPLEILFVREVMRTNVVVLPGDGTLEEAVEAIRAGEQHPQGQHLFPVVDSDSSLLGVVTRNQLLKIAQQTGARCSGHPAFGNRNAESRSCLRRRASSRGRVSNGGVGLYPLSGSRSSVRSTYRGYGLAQRSAARTEPGTWKTSAPAKGY